MKKMEFTLKFVLSKLQLQISFAPKYPANFYPMKITGTGHFIFPALSMEKGCKNHRETLCMLWVDPVIFTDCGEIL